MIIYSPKPTERIHYITAKLAIFNHLGLPTYCKYRNDDEIYAKYNEAGKLTYYESKGKDHEYKVWYDYDINNNRVRLMDSKGFFERAEYDENNNMIFCANPNDKVWIDYDEHNNPIHAETLSGKVEDLRYDDNKNIIFHSVSFMHEITYEYNEFGKLTHYVKKNVDGSIIEYWNIYDSRGKIKSYNDNLGAEEQFIYDDNGYLVNRICNGRHVEEIRYDDNHNEIYSNTDGVEVWSEYNEKNKLIHTKTRGDDGWFEEWHTYDEHGNEIKFKNSVGLTIKSIYNENDQLIFKSEFDDSGWTLTYREYDSSGILVCHRIINDACITTENMKG